MNRSIRLLLLLSALPLLHACPSSSDSLDIVLARGVASADLDQDGRTDIVFAISGSDTGPDQHQGLVFINRSDQRDDFALRKRLNLRGGEFVRPGTVLLGDLNDDGRTDIAIDNGETIYISFQDSGTRGEFAAPIKPGSHIYRHVFAIADLDNDGINDLLVSTGGNELAVQIQDSLNPGTFLPRVSLGFGVSAAAVGDLDGDLINDIALVDSEADRIRILIQNAGVAGTYTESQSFTAGPSLDDVLVVDLDGDGRLDLAAVYSGDFNRDIEGGVSVRLQDPAMPGQFLAETRYENSANGLGFAIGDLNNDSLVDIAVTARPFGGEEVRVAILFQSAASPGTFDIRKEIDDIVFPDSIAIADMDQDLRNDIVISDFQLEISYQRGTSPGSFTDPVEIFDPN